MKKKIAINLSGGLGKHIMFTSILPEIKKKYSEGVYLNTPYVPVFENNKNVNYINKWEEISYKEAIENIKMIFSDPYVHEDFIYKRKHLLEIWAEMLEINYNSEIHFPEIFFNKQEEEEWNFRLSEIKYLVDESPFFLVQFSGGQSPISYDNGGYNQNFNFEYETTKRSYPYMETVSLVKALREKYPEYKIIRFGLNNEILPFEIRNDVITSINMGYKFFSLLAKKANCVITIDSSLQHLAAASKASSIVIWGETSPKHFGYSLHTNIREEQDDKICSYWNTLGKINYNVVFPSFEKVLEEVEKKITKKE
jgi:hypothetical protein